MKRHGWDVVRVDIDPRVKPDIVADLLALPLKPYPVDLLWISPVCTFYSRYDQRASLFPGEPEPSHALYEAAKAVIAEWAPRYWVIENVRGAAIFWGPATFKVGPYHLWTNLPMAPVSGPLRRKHNLCSGTDPLSSAKRGRMPYELSESVRQIVEWAS